MTRMFPSWVRTARARYMCYGALFGCAFPIIATLLDLYVQKMPLSMASIYRVQAAQPLHWIIDTAPFFLGLFASFAGKRQDILAKLNAQLSALNTQLEQRVADRTQELSNANRELAKEVLERKRAEQGLKALNESLEQRVIERTMAAEERAQELARSNAELEQFAYVASHDLQEPLRVVTSYVQLLARRYRGKLNVEADEFIGYVVTGVARMQALINDLLTFSRVGTRGKPLEPTDCNAVIDQVVRNLRVAIEESRAVVTHDPLPTVQSDALQLGQVFQNLIANAIKFRGKEPPRIHVSATHQAGEMVFSVRDSGIGIDPQYAQRIFVIFQRLHPQGDYPGTGIGLAICKKIIERHGGRIWVESQLGQGSTFRFAIPDQQGPRMARAGERSHPDRSQGAGNS